VSTLGAAFNRWESSTCLALNRVNRRRAWSGLFGIASRLGDGVCWYALLLAIAFAGSWMFALLMAACGLACTGVYKALKHGTRRPRPCAVEASLTLTVSPLDTFSFPSGHTLHAVAFTILATAWWAPLGWILWPFTLMVAASRLVLGMHYPSDVAAGAAIGGGMAWLTVAVARTAGMLA
jgi:undecaprenyl-diphosphatase